MKNRAKIRLSFLCGLAVLTLVAGMSFRDLSEVNYHRERSAENERQLIALTNARAKVRNELEAGGRKADESTRGFIKKISEQIDQRQAAAREGMESLEQSLARLERTLACLAAVAFSLAAVVLILTSRSLRIGLTEFSMLVGTVAHEINTPLAVIGLRAEQMEASLKKKEFSSADLLESLTVIRRTVDRIARIVSGLRFFSGESRRTQPENVNAVSLVQDTLSLCAEKFESNGIEFQLVVPKPLETLEVECRPVQISQVILNLLNNAVDAAQANPPTKRKWIRLSLADEGEAIRITVSDSGPGVAEGIQDKIMQPFFTTKTRGQGTGLGLSISTSIMDEHGGKLIFETSSPEASFSVVLPKAFKGSGS